MSIALMTLAWKSNYASGKKMVLLALCDNANDQGECYPSVSMLVEKCSMSERSVFSHISELEKNGAIRRENRPGRSTVYHIDSGKFSTQTTANPAPLQPLHPTSATVAPITINEPSIEPSGNHKTKKPASPFVLPAWIPEETWTAFLDTRKKKKAANTDFALGLVLKTLIRFHDTGCDAIESLENSIKGGWSDVYEPKNGTVKPRTNKQEALEARNRAVSDAWVADMEAKIGANFETV